MECPLGESMYCKLIDPVAFRLKYKQKGFTQKSLADSSDITVSVIYHAIAGHGINLDYGYAISKSLGIEIWDMFQLVK